MTASPIRPDPDDQRFSRPAPALARAEPIACLPVIVLLLHHRCNCRCLMCHLWRDPGDRVLSLDAIAGWLAEWRRLQVKRVVLSGGEPLLYPALEPLTKMLSSAGFHVTILTNGLLLSRFAPLLARYCDELVVSLDGPQPIHDQIRGVPHAFAQLAKGIQKVRESRPSLAITGRCTVQRHNYRYLRQTVAAARALGLDQISFLAADVSSEAFKLTTGPAREHLAEVMLTQEDLGPLGAEIAALGREYRAELASGYIAESGLKLRRRLLHYFGALLGQGEFSPHACNAPWVSALIEPDGRVRPCFFHPPLGNLYEASSLEAVLNSAGAQAWRRRLDPRRHEVCRRCVCSLRLTAAERREPSPKAKEFTRWK
jgi:MoaA/NifB/PqqE/SkfB family radical SAM enzyme